MALFAHGLLPASFRGIPFAVQATDQQFGRRVALHVYPGRDEPWAEDIGRAPRSFRLRGFILTDDIVYAGGPVALQRALLMAAAERAGAGVLTHPTLGVLQVACRGFSTSEDLAAGTMSEVSFDFVESGKRSLPSLLTGSGLFSAAALCDVAIAVDVVRAVALASASTSAGASRAAGASWAGRGEALGRDATSLSRMTARLPGELGRYAGGANVGAQTSTAAEATTIADLVADAAASRAAIAAAADAAIAAATAVDGAAIAATAAALVAALVAACADPADAVRLLVDLAAFVPTASGAVAAAIAAAFRRASVVALARATARYQPSSYDDAAALLARAVALFDAVALEAADAGDDGSYAKLRALRIEVVEDLRVRGAELSRVRTFTVPRPLPALALAQRCYRDPARADQLVRQVDPPSPLFMPAAFRALAA